MSQTASPSAVSRYVEIGGMRLHYQEAGEGRPLVLVHGLGNSTLIWERNLPGLAEAAHVFALDLPGHGLSDKPDVAYTTEMGVNVLARFIETLELGRVTLVGSSVGGLLSLHLALRRADLVSGLVLVGSVGLGREIPWPLRLLTVPLLRRWLARSSQRLIRAWLNYAFADRGLITEDLVKRYTEARARPGVTRAVLSAMKHGATLEGLRPQLMKLWFLNDLLPPLLVVWGARDRLLPVAHAYSARRAHPECHLSVFHDCGHWPQYEQPERFNQAVLDFLAQNERRAVLLRQAS